ncbi:leucine-rich repeat domain-containing protein [Paenibacillus sp. FA6]|uniref:leucine-rich repeat domain-containing protein n=1 Tax=Paenibacillus sp. FA6 TaxID=3413029 RepID=UPI003F65EE3B
MRFYTDPKGEAYERLIDYVIERTVKFVLVEASFGDGKSYEEVMNKLKPFLLEQCSMEEMQAKIGANYSEGTYYIYRCCKEAGNVLKEAVNGLFDWCHPEMPEDLCFVDENGADYLYSIAHEQMCGIHLNEEEAKKLTDLIPGLFIELESHHDFERFLDDAIKHQTDSLSISSYRLVEIPDRIRELKQLKYLEIFEQDITRLPPALFELRTLTTLQIMTADLECIPKEIANLQQLKDLTIYCGSSDRTVQGWAPKAKFDLLLNRIPPELGQLKKLECLNISYTGIKELPPELEKLTQLRYLNVSNSLIRKKPTFLAQMPHLECVNLSDNLIEE